MANYTDNKNPQTDGKLTVNIFASFFSLAAFLAVLWAGAKLYNIVLHVTFPTDLAAVNTLVGTIISIILLSIIFGAASQAGFVIIRKTKADKAIFFLYDIVTFAILLIEGIYAAMSTKNVFFLVPSFFICVATVYSARRTKDGKPVTVKRRR